MKVSHKIQRLFQEVIFFTSICLFFITACVERLDSQVTQSPLNISSTSISTPPWIDGFSTTPNVLETKGTGSASIATATGADTNRVKSASAQEVISMLVEEVSRDRVLYDLNKLTGKEPICNTVECHSISDRLTGSEELTWAKYYIAEELSALNYTVEFFEWSHGNFVDQNIVARKTGAGLPNEEIYIVAHLDGAGSTSKGRSTAADDNASGVVDLLEIARVLNNTSFNRTIVLLFSTGEEQGALGVKARLDQLTIEEFSSIKYVINVDMIGYDENDDHVMEIWHGGQASSLAFAEYFADIINTYRLDLQPKLVVGCG